MASSDMSLDEKVLLAIEAGHGTVRGIIEHLGLQDLRDKDYRVIDKPLQRLRRAGLAKYDKKAWKSLREKPAAQPAPTVGPGPGIPSWPAIGAVAGGKVIDLKEERDKRDQGATEEDFLEGNAFAFEVFEYHEDVLGFIDGPYPVCILLGPDSRTGIVMSKESAEALRNDLSEMLLSEHAPWASKPN